MEMGLNQHYALFDPTHRAGSGVCYLRLVATRIANVGLQILSGEISLNRQRQDILTHSMQTE